MKVHDFNFRARRRNGLYLACHRCALKSDSTTTRRDGDQMNNRFASRQSMIFLAATLLLNVACGAPTQKAEDVSVEFSAPLTLQNRLNRTCNNLVNDQVLNENFKKFGSPECAEAGIHATNLIEDKRLLIRGIEEIKPAQNDGTEYLSAKSQTWVTRSLLGIGIKLTKTLNFDDTNQSIENQNAAGSGDFFSNTDQAIQLPEIEAIAINQELLNGELRPAGRGELTLNPIRVYQPIEVKADGIISVDAKIDLLATIEDESISIVISTKSSEKISFITDLQASLIVIPFANETYLHFESTLGAKTGGWANISRQPLKALIESVVKDVLEDLVTFIE